MIVFPFRDLTFSVLLVLQHELFDLDSVSIPLAKEFLKSKLNFFGLEVAFTDEAMLINDAGEATRWAADSIHSDYV